MNKHSSLTSDCRGATYIMLQEKKPQKNPRKKSKQRNQTNQTKNTHKEAKPGVCAWKGWTPYVAY